MSNRLGKLLFWVLNAFVLLFLAAAMSMPAFATTTAGGVSAAMIMLAPASTGGEQASGILVLCIAVVVFLWCSIWPTRFIWALTMVIRIPVLALLLLTSGMGSFLMRIDQVVALAGRRVLEIGHGQ